MDAVSSALISWSGFNIIFLIGHYNHTLACGTGTPLWKPLLKASRLANAFPWDWHFRPAPVPSRT